MGDWYPRKKFAVIAEIIPEAKSYKLETFSYLIPADMRELVEVGSIVTVPFGRQKIRGVVKSITKYEPAIQSEYQMKEITALNQDYQIPESYISIIEWLASYYFCTPGDAVKLFLPPEMKRPLKTRARANSSYAVIRNLNKEQEQVYRDICSSQKNGKLKPHLIYGVTGSGKTEIYIHLCRDMIDQGKSSVMLVPEIILTPQSVERFEEVFGDNIALIHSGLSKGQKLRAYDDFYSGKKKILIGPRSALLIPNPKIGLIIIDEEHEDAYKQDQSPRYHAADLAEKIAEKLQAILVLGSATPRIETFQKTRTGEYILHQIQARYNKLLLPPSELVDLRGELRSGNSSLISNKLRDALEHVLLNKKQAILFLNRRGASTFVSCRECGEVVQCPNCDIPMIQHISTRSYLYCHHCDLKQEIPAQCHNCGSVKIKFFGAGVEKVEFEVNKLFPKARVKRIDADSIKSKGDYEQFYRDFKDRKFDIAVGTQMLAKGFDMPHVDLVGIVSADTGLHLPYFRSSEKVFRMITQVSGRSGRSFNTGQTIIQTYWPESKAIVAASQHDFLKFYEAEIKNREKHRYPPFCSLLRLVSEDEKPEKARAKLEKIVPRLDELEVEYIGPGMSFFQRLRGKWRYHLIIKLPKSGGERAKNQLRLLWKENLDLVWDVDPIDLL